MIDDSMKKMHTIQNYELADTTIKRAIGIMLRRRVTRPMLFLFDETNVVSIHSFFCPPFDAVFLDKQRKVVGLHRYIRPNHIVSSERPVKYLIEFPPGTIGRLGIAKGTIIKMKSR